DSQLSDESLGLLRLGAQDDEDVVAAAVAQGIDRGVQPRTAVGADHQSLRLAHAAPASGGEEKPEGGRLGHRSIVCVRSLDAGGCQPRCRIRRRCVVVMRFTWRMLLSSLVEASRAVGATRSRLAKRKVIAEALRSARRPEDAAIAALYLSGVLRRRRRGMRLRSRAPLPGAWGYAAA